MCSSDLGFVAAAFGEPFRAVLEWSEDMAEEISREALREQFGPDALEEVDKLEEKDSQLHVALQALTEGESYDLVLSAGSGNGVEALRRLVRRWDPASGGKRRALLKQVLNPDRATLATLPARLEKWEALTRRFERRRANGGPQRPLDDDIRVSALEQLVPQELGNHLALNANRLPDYRAVRAEVVSFLEAHRSQTTATTTRRANDDPMDVDSFGRSKGKGKGGKGDKKGKGKGKQKQQQGQKHNTTSSTTSTCWNCGKAGHRAADCWSAVSGSGSGSGGPGPGKGKSKGKGKKGLGAFGAQEQATGEPASAGSLEAQAGGFHTAAGDLQENVLDMCGLGLASAEVELKGLGWMRFTHDTGAAATAFPLGTPGLPGGPADQNATYKTASGELLSDSGGLRVTGTTEHGDRVRLSGRCTDVHKPLVSASRVHAKGHCSWIESGGGYIFPSTGRLASEIRKLVARRIGAEKGVIPLWEENGTYVGYLWTGDRQTESSRALCPVDGDGGVLGQARRP